MTIANLITWILLAVTCLLVAVTRRRQRHLQDLQATVPTITDSDLHAIRLGWKIQRLAGRIATDGTDGCVRSATTMQVDGRTLWVTVSRYDTAETS